MSAARGTQARRVLHALAASARMAPVLILLAGCSGPTQGAGSWAAGGGGGAAALDFDDAADRAPEPATLLAMARLCAAQGRDGECEELLTRLLAFAPDCLPAYTELAALYLRNDLADGAETVLRRGLAVAPDDAVLRNDLGMCLLLRRLYAPALAEFTRAASLPPLDARHRGNMALALGLLGRDDEALALWMQIVPPQEAHSNLEVVRRARAAQPAQG